MYTGSCLCGAVRYEIHGDVDHASICWCTMCQKQHGAANGPYANVASSALRIVAGLEAITRYASSPGVERTFCGVCGANLTWQMAEHSSRIAVTLGTFDTPYEGLVTDELHTDSKPGWLP
ncbi:GFA family protein [Massilia pseudoviolaceinigra]|uniref:GFA family protein n=1 Tax=Massilia pseudoviolaceinigra TaxID=3057165 RepID=UPI0027966544|nr:GFA family protein [Massilia sp. CCM 9206]MDQ1924978.1 GFA family protein [Massilia sp. CCM 9206]